MRGMPTFQPYAPWLIKIGRSTFLGSRAVHMVSASMSKLSRTGKPFGESGMTCLRSARVRGASAARTGARARDARPGRARGDRRARARRSAAGWERQRRVAGEVERPEIGIPGAADRAGRLAPDGDRLVRVVLDGERRPA